ncbi:MAG: AAA family ATPase [Lachnospiraceae bacterium]|nr:AAA family ATPase [Ruminococcus sp.]MCM1274039.1 AAA family ATPase [Lachnospiraceae bacterium]
MKYIESVKFHGELPEKSYLGGIPAVEWLAERGELELFSEVTFFVGENGAGKSTLLEAIALAAGFNAEGGSRNFSFSTRDTHSELYDNITLSRGIYRPKDGFFLRAESLYNSATYIDELDEIPCGAPSISGGYGGSLHKESHGESFIATVQNRFFGNGLYILDEPEAALSPARQLTMLGLIKGLVDDNSQFIIATHSPILMAYPNAEILRFSDGGIDRIGYKQTEHYQITKRFLDSPERTLEMIFGENSGNG